MPGEIKVVAAAMVEMRVENRKKDSSRRCCCCVCVCVWSIILIFLAYRSIIYIFFEILCCVI